MPNSRSEALHFLTPDWPAPKPVRAAVSLRVGGASTGPYASLNLAAHVGDAAEPVAENRRRLRAALGLPGEPLWLSQVHGVAVAHHDGSHAAAPEADAAWTSTSERICAVLTADCLPVLFCDRDGTRVAAAHAGWRGLADGVLETTLSALALPGERVLAWLGPAIGPTAFEVGEDVRAAFLARDGGAGECFLRNGRGRWHADLYALARRRLAAAGVTAVYGGGRCTYGEGEAFFSYRREETTGRFASLIWLDGADA